MDVVGGTGWDHATTLCRGISCLRPRDGSISQLDGDESAKGFWAAAYTSARQAAGPGSADTHTACLKPWVQEVRFLWHRLGPAPADLDRKSREPQSQCESRRIPPSFENRLPSQ